MLKPWRFGRNDQVAQALTEAGIRAGAVPALIHQSYPRSALTDSRNGTWGGIYSFQKLPTWQIMSTL